jgi:hypothetical protein
MPLGVASSAITADGASIKRYLWPQKIIYKKRKPMLIQLTNLSPDPKFNGKKFYINPEDVIRISEVTVKSDTTVIIGQTKEIPGTAIYLRPDSITPRCFSQELQDKVAHIVNRTRENAEFLMKYSDTGRELLTEEPEAA